MHSAYPLVNLCNQSKSANIDNFQTIAKSRVVASWPNLRQSNKKTKHPPPKKNPTKNKKQLTPRHICCPVVNRFHGLSANFLQRRPRSIVWIFFRSVCPLANIASRIVVSWCQRHKCYLCLFMLFMSLMVHGKPGKTDLHVISIWKIQKPSRVKGHIA